MTVTITTNVGISWKRMQNVLAFFLTVVMTLQRNFSLLGGCFGLHLHPLEIKSTLFYPYGDFRRIFGDAVKQRLRRRTQWAHIQNLTYAEDANKIKTSLASLWTGFLLLCLPPFDKHDVWLGKSHFHKCFILPPLSMASLERELWPAWPASIFPRAYPFLICRHGAASHGAAWVKKAYYQNTPVASASADQPLAWEFTRQ